nr:hypothetical protein [uncultured Carboxylicivirga sp.]
MNVSLSRNSKILIYGLLYLFINNLFILKYVSRVNHVNEYMVAMGYSIAIIVGSFIYQRFTLHHKVYSYLFYGLTIFFFLFSIVVNYKVDGNSLNVDRWSALDYGIRALLNGEYPYTAGTHMGGRTSNLPSLLFIGIPFYFMGDVGYLQSFSFLLFAYIICKYVEGYKNRLFILILFCLSFSYLWEIFTKSDLISNVIVLIWFLFASQKWMARRRSMDIVTIAALAVSIFLTRVVVVVPLLLLLTNYFFHLDGRKKVLFVLTGLVVLLSFVAICFQHYGDINNLMLYNPIALQNRQLPLFISILCVIIPLVLSFFIKEKGKLFSLILLFLSIPLFLAFGSHLLEDGFTDALMLSYFDISYFNFLTPFAIYLFVHEITQTKMVYAEE